MPPVQILFKLQSWISSGESETQEFKRSTAELKSGMQTLSALCNHKGGRLFFGVGDNGHIVGQTTSDATLRDLAQEVRRIDPPIQPEISTIPIGENNQVIVVSIERGHNRPYTYNGKAYKRIGNTTSELTRDEYNRILLEGSHADKRWEIQRTENWTADDVDPVELTRTVDESVRRGRMEDPGTRDTRELLRGLGLIVNDQLLRAALVLFGTSKALELRMPQCLLRVARFRGDDKTEFIDNRQFHGNIFELLQHAERFLRDNLPVAGRVQPGTIERADEPLYPHIALRETLANAFCHRDYGIGGGSVSVAVYDNRLEITSSGTLHFGLTPEALYTTHDSLPWNPLIARVLYRRGIIESWGRGTLKIIESTTNAGLPRPAIIEAGGCVTVRFTPSHYLPPQRIARDITERQQRVLSVLANARGGMAVREITAQLKVEKTPWLVREDLAVLKALGMVANRGHGRGAFWRIC